MSWKICIYIYIDITYLYIPQVSLKNVGKNAQNQASLNNLEKMYETLPQKHPTFLHNSCWPQVHAVVHLKIFPDSRRHTEKPVKIPFLGSLKNCYLFFLMEKNGWNFYLPIFCDLFGMTKNVTFSKVKWPPTIGDKKGHGLNHLLSIRRKSRGKKKNCNTKTNLLRSPWNQFSIDPRPWRFFFRNLVDEIDEKNCSLQRDDGPKLGGLKHLVGFGVKGINQTTFWFKISLLFFWNKTIPPILGGCLFLWAEGVNTIPLSQHLPVHIPTSVWVLPRSLTAKSRWKDISHPNRKGNVSPRLPAQLSEFSGVLAGCEKLLGPCVQDGDPLTTISGLIPSYTH